MSIAAKISRFPVLLLMMGFSCHPVAADVGQSTPQASGRQQASQHLEGGNSAFAALRIYEEKFSGNETGIYEESGRLIFQIRLPFDASKDRKDRKRARAMSQSNKMMREWAWNQFADQRKESLGKLLGSWGKVKKIIDHFDPGWCGRKWNMSLVCQHTPPKISDGWYSTAVIVDKKSFMSAVPETFKGCPTSMELIVALRELFVRQTHRRDELFTEIGLWRANADAQWAAFEKNLKIALSQVERQDICLLGVAQAFELSNQHEAAVAAAIVACGLSTDAWCIQQCEALISK